MTKQVALILTATDELFAKTFEIGDSYEMLKEGVGGWLELVRLNHGVDMWVNENGIAENLPYNATATAIYWSNFGFMSGQIFGDVVFTNSNAEGDTIGLTVLQGGYLKEIAFDIVGLKIKTLA
jgi:hypothetical protein